MATIVNLKFKEEPVTTCKTHWRELTWNGVTRRSFMRARYFQQVATFDMRDHTHHLTFDIHFTVEKLVESDGDVTWIIQSPERFKYDEYTWIGEIHGQGRTMHEAWADFRRVWHIYGRPFGKSYMRVIVGNCGDSPIYGRADRYENFE